MSKHISQHIFYRLPSGCQVHPSRLIVRDGTLMWKHAFHSCNQFTQLPVEIEHEENIVKTAQRLEELNLWVSRNLDLCNSIRPIRWYDPSVNHFKYGNQVSIQHPLLLQEEVFDILKDKMNPNENIFFDNNELTFARC